MNVEYTPENENIKIKRLWHRLWGPSEIHRLFLALRDPDWCTGCTPSHRPRLWDVTALLSQISYRDTIWIFVEFYKEGEWKTSNACSGGYFNGGLRVSCFYIFFIITTFFFRLLFYTSWQVEHLYNCIQDCTSSRVVKTCHNTSLLVTMIAIQDISYIYPIRIWIINGSYLVCMTF
jgi:hypothetical protein